MRLFVKITPMRAGTAEPVGVPEMMPCAADVEPDTIRSYLVQRFGDPVEVAWTTTRQHARVSIGWIFRGEPVTDAADATELLCVPFAETADRSLLPLFELQADQRQEFEELARSRALDQYTVIEQPQREYRPPHGGQGTQC
jgi:hypothetical protein